MEPKSKWISAGKIMKMMGYDHIDMREIFVDMAYKDVRNSDYNDGFGNPTEDAEGYGLSDVYPVDYYPPPFKKHDFDIAIYKRSDIKTVHPEIYKKLLSQEKNFPYNIEGKPKSPKSSLSGLEQKSKDQSHKKTQERLLSKYLNIAINHSRELKRRTKQPPTEFELADYLESELRKNNEQLGLRSLLPTGILRQIRKKIPKRLKREIGEKTIK